MLVREYIVGEGEVILLSISPPSFDFVTECFNCQWKVNSSKVEISRTSVGIDAIQSLIHAIKDAASYLYTTHDFGRARPYWTYGVNEKDLGLILPDSIKDLGDLSS
ncbi:DUF6968 family protein [Brevundimonas diminuta]|uniref:DUF6968 family protein n=1 Tax=Brevundimonas diminuta TaxID=293 RepID=UPI003CCA0884